MFQSMLKIKMITVQVNGNEMAWVCENHFGFEPNVQMAYSIETFAWDDDGSLLIKTYYPMPESVGTEGDPYAHLSGGAGVGGQQILAGEANSASSVGL